MQYPHTNDLIHETSPYLLQHAHNPVQWYPWGEKALQKAKEEDKPILVSIGYAACHWCHVMERESFENEEVAAYMNRHFINIKIDREERPDLDNIYMDAVQAITGSGGWPLNVFLTTHARPFYGGTYFPPQKAYNRASWTNVLHHIKESWEKRREEVEAQASRLLAHIQNSSDFFIKNTVVPDEGEENPISRELCTTICEGILKNADPAEGGFGKAPKFPQTYSIQYLLLYSHFFHDEKALGHAVFSLKCMLRGGIYDHLAGGLARYSTDDRWLAPHFEKMLYDNALLVSVLCDAYQVSGDVMFEEAIHKTLQFCLDEMKDPDGGFYAALDADSEGEEGKYYVWDKTEIETILGENAGLFCEWYQVTDEGNWDGKNILHTRDDRDAFAKEKNMTTARLNEMLHDAENRLLGIRNKRPRPLTDDKILLGWNALLLTSFCKAFAVTGKEKYKQTAVALYEFISDTFSNDNGIVYHTYKNGQAKYPAFLDDYAYLIQACISLQEITFNEQYLEDAQRLTRYVTDHFQLEGNGFFYYTNREQKDIITRKVEVYDGALPSGNSIMAGNLMYLSVVFDNPDWHRKAHAMFTAMIPVIAKHPNSFAGWGTGIIKQAIGSIEIVVTGTEAAALAEDVLKQFIPNRILQGSAVEKDFPMLANKKYDQGALIYLCKNNSCFDPVGTINDFRELLKNT